MLPAPPESSTLACLSRSASDIIATIATIPPTTMYSCKFQCQFFCTAASTHLCVPFISSYNIIVQQCHKKPAVKENCPFIARLLFTLAQSWTVLLPSVCCSLPFCRRWQIHNGGYLLAACQSQQLSQAVQPIPLAAPMLNMEVGDVELGYPGIFSGILYKVQSLVPVCELYVRISPSRAARQRMRFVACSFRCAD